jgi:hypothetical protein
MFRDQFLLPFRNQCMVNDWIRFTVTWEGTADAAWNAVAIFTFIKVDHRRSFISPGGKDHGSAVQCRGQ